jgi:hypothetical protein
MGGFTQDDGYVRGVAADALRRILLRPCRASSASMFQTFFQNTLMMPINGMNLRTLGVNCTLFGVNE